MFRYFAVLIVTVVIAVGLVGQVYAEQGKSITVGSKIDTEGALLGQMIILMLEENDFSIEDKTEFGPTPIVRKAIISGEIDIYPEYTGNGAFFFSGQDAGLWKDHDRGYAKVKELDFRENKLVWLTPAPADNTWALAVRADFADKNGLKTLADFAKHVNEGGEIKLAACEEFVTREDALPAFEKAYGFSIDDSEMIVFSGCNTAQTEKAAARGTSGVNTAMAFGTDGALSALGLELLEDIKGVQPVYAPTPVVRKDVFDKYPQLEKILAPVFKALSQQTLQKLNAQIAVGGENPGKVARGFLTENDFL
ncbi:MAG: glycine betaine ABC transporter substrate-binding protein OsmF [Thermodesulfobacteriota bacterium]